VSRIDYVGLAKQEELGTAVTEMEYFPPQTEFSPTRNAELLTLEETLGDRFPEQKDPGTEFFEANWAGAVHMASFPRVASAHFGAPDSGVDGDLNSHLFDPTLIDPNDIPFHSLIQARKDPTPAIFDFLYDALVNTLSMNVDVNTYLTYAAAWVAISRDADAELPDVIRDTSRRLNFKHARVYVSINGGVEAELKVGKWGFESTNNLVSDPGETGILGSAHLDELPVGNAGCTATFTVRDKSQLSDYYLRAFQTEPDSIALRMTALHPVTLEKVEFKVYSCNEIDAPAPGSATNVLRGIDISAEAHKDTDTGKFVTLELVNDVAAYA
jgi:hypothetical protein